MHTKSFFKNSKTRTFSLLVACIGVFITTASFAVSENTDALEYVAVVNNKKIPMEEFQLNVDMVKNSYDEMGFHLEEGQLEELKKIILDSLIEKELLLQESEAKGIEIDAAAVEEEIDTIRSGFPDAPAFEKRIQEMGYTLDFLKHEIRSNMTIEALIEQELASKVAVSDEQMKSFYDAGIENFRTPERIKARHILVTNESGGREKIEEIQKEIQEGGDFQKLAEEHSQCPSGQNGGDLGYFSRGQMVDAFENAAFALEIGEVSDIVETRFGYHIIKLEAHQKEETKPLEAVKDDIAKEIRRQEVASRLPPYIESLKQTYPVEIMMPGAEAEEN